VVGRHTLSTAIDRRSNASRMLAGMEAGGLQESSNPQEINAAVVLARTHSAFPCDRK